jgi:hypothetical protein
MPIPESHQRELDRRSANLHTAPGSLLTLEELQKRIGNRVVARIKKKSELAEEASLMKKG